VKLLARVKEALRLKPTQARTPGSRRRRRSAPSFGSNSSTPRSSFGNAPSAAAKRGLPFVGALKTDASALPVARASLVKFGAPLLLAAPLQSRPQPPQALITAVRDSVVLDAVVEEDLSAPSLPMLQNLNSGVLTGVRRMPPSAVPEVAAETRHPVTIPTLCFDALRDAAAGAVQTDQAEVRGGRAGVG